MFIIHRTY